MEQITFLVAVVVITALAFDFTNGFHDTANAMATSIATGALRPKAAVAIAAVLNLTGAFLSVEVAKTISGGIIDETAGLQPRTIFAALVGAILWNLLTWLRGLPSSSSHALYGGLIGATLAGIGVDGVHFDTVLTKILIPAAASPVVAGLASWGATKLAYRISRKGDPDTTRRSFRTGQIASASLIALAHGTNDAQKTMGVITLTLISAGTLGANAGPPLWVVFSSGLAIALGTYMGGWRIIRTMGKGLTQIQSPQGFAAETASTAVILTSSHMGFGLSTTQVCTGGILGAGLGGPRPEVSWTVARRMIYTWALTLPAAATVGALGALLADLGNIGVAGLGVLLVAGATAAWATSRRQPVNASNVTDEETAPQPAAPVGVPAQAAPMTAVPATAAVKEA
jgi:PiT family inorganic phosphate transporter